nr:hypothetical protein [Tanacetum cinerariifolium]GFA35663.1 hypothetical protein [Tanacetum cinerariifolium]
MNPIATQKAALDNALVPSEKRLKLLLKSHKSSCIDFVLPLRRSEIQMHTNFKLEKKKFRVDMEVFHDILHICPRILNQDFIAPPSEKELVTFIQELGYSSKCNMLSIIHTDQMHHPWRTFVAIINRCIFGKTTRLDRLRES